MTTFATPPACLSCKHLSPEGRVCAAYKTKLIPLEIWLSEDDHSSLRGDEDVPLTFTPKDD